MGDHKIVQTSAVYICGAPQFPADPPPSPPSPVTPESSDLCAPIEELRLDQEDDDDDGEAGGDTKQEVASSRCSERLSQAVHVLSTEAIALQAATKLFASDRTARSAFDKAVEAITARQRDPARRGKVVIAGVGKSGLIARKLAATFSSLAVPAVFLHPTEAVHGDLGLVDARRDVLVLVTFSARTPELLVLLPHLDAALPVVLLTAHDGRDRDACAVVQARPDMDVTLLPAPVHEVEAVSFGVAAPTTSTTVALAVGDALALVCARELHGVGVPEVFRRNHPGGAIGASFVKPKQARDCMVPWVDIPQAHATHEATGADILLAGYRSPSGWVRVGEHEVASPSMIRRLAPPDILRKADDVPGLLASRRDFVTLSANLPMRYVIDLVKSLPKTTTCMGIDQDGVSVLVVGVLDHRGECIGVLEVDDLLKQES